MFDFMDIVAAVLFLLFGLLAVCGFFYQIFVIRGTNWATTYGRVVSSYVKETYNRRGDDANSRWMYKPIVEYEFEIDKKKYSNDDIFAGSDFKTNSKDGIRAIVEKFPKGMTVEIFYDPEDPKRSFLEKKVYGGFYFILTIGLVFLVIGFVLLYYKMK